MRKFIQILLIFSLPLIAQAQFCKITYFSQEGEKFWLIVDGERKNEQAATNVSFTLFGITPLGTVNHQVKIIFEDEKLGNFDTSFRTNYRRDQTFMIRKGKDGYETKRTRSAMSTGFF